MAQREVPAKRAGGSRQAEPGAAAAGRERAAEPLRAPTGHPPLNEVRLRGRWAGALERELPSGDVLVSARLVVGRAGSGVDTIDCAVWREGLRRRALAVPDGTVLEVDGSLRRRFWRTPGGPASRYEVEVTGLRRAPAPAKPPATG